MAAISVVLPLCACPTTATLRISLPWYVFMERSFDPRDGSAIEGGCRRLRRDRRGGLGPRRRAVAESGIGKDERASRRGRGPKVLASWMAQGCCGGVVHGVLRAGLPGVGLPVCRLP